MQEQLKILVVDDEESIRSVLHQALSDDGYNVTAAASAEEALLIFRNEPFPLVISDIRLTGLSGLQLLQEIKNINYDTQVIMMTSHGTLQATIQALRDGAYDFLLKPFEDIDMVSAAVRRAFEKICLIEENRRLIKELGQKNRELESRNLALAELSIRDGLTGLYNHRYMHEFLSNEISRCRRHGRVISVIFLDVDHFKIYNDTHGHPAGDALLKTLGKIVSERLRKVDVLARYGGEEFVIVLPDTFKEQAALIAESIRKTIDGHEFFGRETQPLGRVSASFGVAAFTDEGADADALLSLVDKALYRAKEEGRNRVCVHNKPKSENE